MTGSRVGCEIGIIVEYGIGLTGIKISGNLKITIPPALSGLLGRLREAGHEAYAVGGCVRDALLGRTPEDWDVTTSARPEEVKALFRRTVDTGIRHGTVTVLMRERRQQDADVQEKDGRQQKDAAQDKDAAKPERGGDGRLVSYEVTTFRVDGDYRDGRHPESVSFAASLEEDLKRRDFTINAMAYSGETGLVDLYHGVEDLEKGLIRAVGDPEERFREDALRMLRAVRFSAQLGFGIEEKTAQAVKDLSGRLSMISAERIQTELKKIMACERPEGIRAAFELGLTAVFLPEFDLCMETDQNTPHHAYTVGEHTLKTLEALHEIPLSDPDRPEIALALLFHDIGKPGAKTTEQDGLDHFKGHASLGARMTAEILRRLKFDNKTISLTSKLVENHEFRTPLTDRAVRRLMARTGDENMDMLLKLRKCDILGQSDYLREEKLKGLWELREQVAKIRANRDALKISDLKIGGKELKEIGISEGPVFGQILKTLLEEVLAEPSLNERETLLERVRQMLDQES